MPCDIIFYFSDQQRWDTCGCFGQPLDVTPNLDALAREGVKFNSAFSPQPVCGPCRALFQTGLWPTETGCFRNNVMALEFLEGCDGKRPFFMTVSQIEPHHQNDHGHYEGPEGSRERFRNFVLPGDLAALGGGAAVEELVSTASLPKTILALAGVDVGEAMIGENLLDVVRRTDPGRPNEVFAQISESRVGRCVRTARYTYSVCAPGVDGGSAPAADHYVDDFLYDLERDPWQLRNAVSDPAYAQVKAELRARLTPPFSPTRSPASFV